MTYREFQESIQAYLNRHGWVEGNSSQQERMANKPCHDAIDQCIIHDKLTLRRSTYAGYFYDVYAKIVAQDICIGYMFDDGTIKKQAVQFRLKKMDEYGDKEFIEALLMIAKDFYEGKLDKEHQQLDIKRTEVKGLEDKVCETRSILQRITEAKDI